MLIRSLELYGYKRLRLNSVKLLRFNFSELIQLILGTNGCGKSSVLAELNPQPANPAWYDKDGHKIIVIEEKGRTYTLTSKFSNKKAIHSFVVDGDVELNDQGSMSVQKELVKQHFNHTPEIQELLLGNEKFSAMGPARRQKWMTTLCPTDYTFAIKAFIKLKEQARDTVGALKRAQERLVEETTKAISAEDVDRLTRETDQIHRELNELQSHRSPLDNPVSHYQGLQDDLVRELGAMSMRLLNTRLSAPNDDVRNPLRTRDEWGQVHVPAFESVTDVDRAIEGLTHSIISRETLLNNAVSNHEKLTKNLATLIQAGREGMEDLNKRLISADARKQEILGRRRLGLPGINGIAASATLETVYDFISGVLSTIPENPDRRYSSDNYEKARADLMALRNARTEMMSTLQSFNARKAHMEQHHATGTLDCPKCSHSWNANFNENAYEELLKNIADQNEIINETDKKIVVVEEEVEANLNYGNEYRGFVRCTQGAPELNPLWDHLFESNMVSVSPRQALGVIHTFRSDLRHEIDAGVVVKEMDDIYKLIKLVEETGDLNFADVSDRLNECTLTIERLTEDVTLLRNSVQEHSRYRKQVVDMIELGEKITNTLQNIRFVTVDMVEMLRRETLQLCIRQYQSSLAQKEEILNYVTLQRAKVEDLKEQINVLLLEDEACKELVKHLSPSEGLIAKGLLGFIRTFIGQMNGLIRKIWTYPLQVLDCGSVGVHGTELDYKFPMVVQSAIDDPMKDISEGSSGMREIIDLAFKVIAMNYLGMAEHPLMLDEFGNTFDEAHRSSAMHVIKKLMEEKPYTQLFMVSHYSPQYGSLTQAEICVLCTANITVPKATKYNQHVFIE